MGVKTEKGKAAAASSRSERTEITRARFIQSAEKIFARDGFEAAKLEELAADAGYTRGAFYANFDSKEDLFFALLEKEISARIAALEQEMDQVRDPEARDDARVLSEEGAGPTLVPAGAGIQAVRSATSGSEASAGGYASPLCRAESRLSRRGDESAGEGATGVSVCYRGCDGRAGHIANSGTHAGSGDDAGGRRAAHHVKLLRQPDCRDESVAARDSPGN